MHVGHILLRPQALCDGCSPRPEPGVNIFRRHIFRPHASLATENALLFFWSETRRRATDRFNRVVPRSWPVQVDVISERKKAAISQLSRRRERILAAPGLHDNIFR